MGSNLFFSPGSRGSRALGRDFIRHKLELEDMMHFVIALPWSAASSSLSEMFVPFDSSLWYIGRLKTSSPECPRWQEQWTALAGLFRQSKHDSKDRPTVRSSAPEHRT